MKLWTIFFTYADHEDESEVFAHGDNPRPSTEDARQYLLSQFGGEGEYMSEPDRLSISGVYELTTVFDKNGNPYKVTAG